MKNSKARVILSFLGTITLILALSLFVTQTFGGHSEKVFVPTSVSATNNLKLDTVKNALKIKDTADLSKTLK